MSTLTQAIANSEKEFSPAATSGYVPAKAILAFVAACAVAKLFGAWATGFAGDESYTVVISRTLALSYFDHPPLHQWIVHAFGALTGEGWWLRLPFILMIAAINAPLYALTRCLFGRGAAIWALFGFNATAYFTVWPDGYIMPDVPLFLFLATAIWAVAEILFGPRRGSGGYALLWLAAGLAFGLAGLSKYSAVFAPMGLFGYLVFSRRHRSWLWRPQPYLGAAVALAVFAPALIWNLQNHWVSFAFQSGRAGRGLHFDAAGLTHAAQALSSQIALISPWIGIPLVLALADALRSRDPESGQRFLLWLTSVPFVFFTWTTFLGQNPIPHWYNSAWLFAFPLLGHKLSMMKPSWLRSWSRISAGLAAATFLLFIGYVGAGPFWATSAYQAKFKDPTIWFFDWHGLREFASEDTAGGKPDFAVVSRWEAGGKVGLDLGPGMQVCAFTQDAREFAFLCDTSALVGKDALIAIPKEDVERTFPGVAAYFERLGPTIEIGEGRGNRTERVVTLTRGYKLLRPYETPYGINAKPASGG